MWALMGMWPSADLNYGMDLGEWEYAEPEEGEDHDLPWATWERWDKCWEWGSLSSEVLEEAGIKGVQLANYGHPDVPRMALITKAIGCSGWGDLTEVTRKALDITDDDERLLAAWKILFPDREPGPIAWRLSANFS